MSVKPRDERQIAYLCAQMASAVGVGLKDIVSSAGLSVEQWRVLAYLTTAGGQPMTVLARQVFVEAATLTKMVDRLVTDALVFRTLDPRDRRRVLVLIAPKGEDTVEALAPAVTAYDLRLSEVLGAHRLRALVEAVDLLGESVRASRDLPNSREEKRLEDDPNRKLAEDDPLNAQSSI